MNNQPQTILPNIPLIEATESNEYLTHRHEKSKQLMCKKCVMESDEQQDKRNSQNALNILGQCVELESITTELLSASNRKLLRNFHTTINELSNKLCNVCNEQFPSIKLVQGEYDVPQELQNLTEVKEMLIAQEFATCLLHHLSSLNMLIMQHNSSDQSAFRNFQVCRDKISRALHWLKENNIFYCDIEIANDILQSLLENNTIIDQLSEASNSQKLYNGQTDNLDGNENEDSENFIS
ncbi:872_t:CDS:2 [Gigaspora margarita]|uniref:872_t:CDS:1 n=1 Tax=Gigaspora margarita TaxID=4874 RepID=A0ABN7V8B8_GIGMA|nr:872_t:CDS:2 [Gigaspora margarita]